MRGNQISNKKRKKFNPKLPAVTLVFLLLFISAYYSFTNNSNAQIENSATTSLQKIPNSPCNCVVFRLDDVNNDWLSTVQMNIMDKFISESQSLSLGMIMHKIDNASILTETIKEGKERGLFELDIHGWDHVDYTQLSNEEQFRTLQQANEKMNAIFGLYSQVFIPPYNKFNGDTIESLQSAGIRIISSDTSNDKTNYFTSVGRNENGFESTLYHLPAMTTFKSDNGNGTWIKIPIQKIQSDIDYSISKYGYAVVMLHPQNFAKMENGMYIDTLDDDEIKDLSYLIDSIRSKNLQISTFTNVVGLKTVTTVSLQSISVPEFHGIESMVLMISILPILWFTISFRKNGVFKR